MQEWTIDELAQISGVSVRNIRYYLAEGLLPSAEQRGKYALYGESHLIRLRCIQRLKEAFFPLAAIKTQLEQLSEAQIAALAEGDTTAVPALQESRDEAAKAAERTESSPFREGAAAYIAGIRARQAQNAPTQGIAQNVAVPPVAPPAAEAVSKAAHEAVAPPAAPSPAASSTAAVGSDAAGRAPAPSERPASPPLSVGAAPSSSDGAGVASKARALQTASADAPAAPGGLPLAAPGGLPLAAPGGLPLAAPGGLPLAAPGGLPLAAPGGLPLAAPGGLPLAAPGGLPLAAPGGLPLAAPGGPPTAPSDGSALTRETNVLTRPLPVDADGSALTREIWEHVQLVGGVELRFRVPPEPGVQDIIDRLLAFAQNLRLTVPFREKENKP